MPDLIKIAIVDDELLFRRGIKGIIENQDDFKVLYDLENGQQLIERLRSARSKPQIVITDLKMPILNGVEVTKMISEEFPNIKIIALTSYFSKPFIVNMLSIGAVAYLAKNSTPDLMLTTIRAVHKNGFYYGSDVQKYVHEIEYNKSKSIKSALDKDLFTRRELDVLNLLCKAYNRKEIADKLSISTRTFDIHRKSMLLKSDTKNIAGLVIFAIKYKLVNIDE